MAININHNLFSILVQRNLERTTQKLEKSYENLTSGERINRAADDPAGMATSEALRYEMQGLRQNQKNVSGAFNLLGTAESQLDTMVDLSQRMRELLVQGGNDTLNASDRQALQGEINQLLDEMDRIASTSKFNEQSLLNGQLKGLRVQIGTLASETVTISLPDFRIGILGSYASKSSDQAVGTTALAAGAVQISGVAVPAAKYDGVSSVASSASAIAKAAAINEVETQTGVHATALPSTLTASQPVQPLSLDGASNVLRINGVSFYPLTIPAGGSPNALVALINTRSASTGVTASLTNSGALELTAQDGRNIEVVTQGSIGDELGLRPDNGDVNLVTTGKIQLSGARGFSITDPTGVLGMTTPSQQVSPDSSTALQGINVNDPASATQSLRAVDAALAQLSDGRSILGALNNRLENLNDTLARRIEDLTKTDSAIRDTDFAFESARLAQNQIIQEAALSMLTQANVAPRRALELLQSG